MNREMKYWKMGHTDQGYGPVGLILRATPHENRVLSIAKIQDGKVRFAEECDGHFDSVMTVEDAISALREAINWIEGG